MIQEIITYIIIFSAFAYAGYGFVKLVIPNKTKSGCSACSASLTCGLKSVKENQKSKVKFSTTQFYTKPL